jgi:hypothetical protein
VVCVCLLFLCIFSLIYDTIAVFDEKSCGNTCQYQIVESLPDQFSLKLLPGTDLTYNAWIGMY